MKNQHLQKTPTRQLVTQIHFQQPFQPHQEKNRILGLIRQIHQEKP
jgi:hypothetical protein